MDTAGTAMMFRAQPGQIGRRLNPRPNLVWVGHPRVDMLQPGQVHAVLKGELDVSVMQLKAALAFRVVASLNGELAAR